MRKTPFVSGEYYHVYNRGVDKRIIYLDDQDYFRFLKEIRFMNNLERVVNLNKTKHCIETESRYSKCEELVDVVAYCLMPNHFHIILRQLTDNGISKFMQKLAIGYTQYFNLKYERSGVLFQGAFKAKQILDNTYLLHLSRYIHQNPLKLFKGNNSSLNNELRRYKWSSLPFYLDDKKRCLVHLVKDSIVQQFQKKEDFESFVFNYVSSELEGFSSLLLE